MALSESFHEIGCVLGRTVVDGEKMVVGRVASGERGDIGFLDGSGAFVEEEDDGNGVEVGREEVAAEGGESPSPLLLLEGELLAEDQSPHGMMKYLVGTDRCSGRWFWKPQGMRRDRVTDRTLGHLREPLWCCLAKELNLVRWALWGIWGWCLLFKMHGPHPAYKGPQEATIRCLFAVFI